MAVFLLCILVTVNLEFAVCYYFKDCLLKDQDSMKAVRRAEGLISL